VLSKFCQELARKFLLRKLLGVTPSADRDTARTHVLANFPGFEFADVFDSREQLFIAELIALSD